MENTVFDITLDSNDKIPHFIILEITDDSSKKINNKPISFSIQNTHYRLDSCIIRDTSQQHFCALLTCEKKDMAYDGMSFHRLVPLPWKSMLNKNKTWEFDGSNNIDGKPLQWNFLKGYQVLVYYRV